MIRRKRIAGLFLSAAVLAAALPIVGTAAPDVVLPDLVSDRPEGADTAPVTYTYPDGTQALLQRFDGFIHNSGAGPVEFRGSARSGSTMTDVSQYAKPSGGGSLVAIPPPTSRKPEILFETGDGHDHWHFKNAAYYSLWNASKTAEVAPGMKVGFCLEDSQRRESHGPSTAVYSDGAVRFCEADNPTTSSVYMGISAGWRDQYYRTLAFQWVDISEVQPGKYWLAAEVDPLNLVTESSESNNTRAFASVQSTVPGYLAVPVAAGTLPANTASTVTLASQTFGSPGNRRFRIESLPAHGTLRQGTTTLTVGKTFTDPNVTYTPASGYTGPDTFDFSAYDANSAFPRKDAAAGVSFTVGAATTETSVAISGAPASLDTGASAQLSATVTNGTGGVTWSVDGVTGGNATVGTISTSGLYRAPDAVPSGGSVTIRATSSSTPTAFDEEVVRITLASEPDPAPISSANLVRNPSFEADLTGWSGWQSSLSRVQLGDAPEGVYAAKVTRSTGSSYTIDDAPTTLTSATGGATYRARAFVKAASSSSVGKAMRVALRERNSSGVVRTVNGTSVTLGNSFQPVTVDITGVAAGNAVDMYVVQSSAGTGNAFYVDAISLADASGGGTPANEPPVASFTPSSTTVAEGTTVTFTSTSSDADDGISSLAWDLDGNGTYTDASGASASRSFPTAGTYTVRLRATDAAGQTDTATGTVTVTSSTSASTNLVRNPSFEADLSGWISYGGSLSRVTLSGAPSGSYVARVSRASGSTASTFTIDDSPSSVGSAVGGATYTARAMVRAVSTTGRPARIVVRERSASTGSVVRVVDGARVSLTTSFQPVTAQIANVTAGNGIDIYVVQSLATTGDAFYVDDISLTR